MGWWGQYRPGQCIISSFPNAASANKSEQVVISAPFGWEWGEWGQYRPEQFVSSSFPNAASAKKSGQVVISAPVGWGGVFGTLQARTIRFIIISKCSFCKQEWTGSNLCPCWLGMGWWVKYRAGTIRFIIISKCSFCKQERTYLGGQVVISAPAG
jgi:hypothetical protein